MKGFLREFESYVLILSSLVVLAMSYGLIASSWGIVLFIGLISLIINLVNINLLTKAEFLEIADGTVSTLDKLMRKGIILGTTRFILMWAMLVTLVTFNLFAWQLYIFSMFLSVYVAFKTAEKFNIDLKKEIK